MRKNRGMYMTQDYTFEVKGRFVYCDSANIQQIDSANMKNKNLNFLPKRLQTSPGSPQIMTNATMT